MYTVYIMLCKDESLYTGIARDVEKRFHAHQLGQGAKYTRAKKPVRIVYMERKRNRSYALKREAQIKKLSRPEKLALIGAFVPHDKI